MKRYQAALETVRTLALVVIAGVLATALRPCTPPDEPTPVASTKR